MAANLPSDTLLGAVVGSLVGAGIGALFGRVETGILAGAGIGGVVGLTGVGPMRETVEPEPRMGILLVAVERRVILLPSSTPTADSTTPPSP